MEFCSSILKYWLNWTAAAPVAIINLGPKNGREVVIGLTVRRFLCLAPGCEKVNVRGAGHSLEMRAPLSQWLLGRAVP